MTAQRKKVLIAEDEKPMATALKLKLEKNGFEVATAANGNEAIEFLKLGDFDLGLIDLMMPIKDGFAVLEEAARLKIQTPLVVASNLSQGGDIEKAKSLGAVDYFVKSDTAISEIVQKVRSILEK